MASLEAAIEEAITNPEQVIISVVDPNVRLYYWSCRGTLVGDKYLCVVVKLRGADAFVLTAYLTDRVRRGAQVWPETD